MQLIASIDIEATGSCPALNSCVMIGVVVVEDNRAHVTEENFNDRIIERKQWCIKEYRPREQRCMDEFWSKNQQLMDYIKEHARDVREVMAEFASWLRVLMANNKVLFVAKPSSYDWAWITDLYYTYGPEDKVGLPHSVSCISTCWRLAERLLPDRKTELAEYVKNGSLVHTHYADDDAALQCFTYLRIMQFMGTHGEY